MAASLFRNFTCLSAFTVTVSLTMLSLALLSINTNALRNVHNGMFKFQGFNFSSIYHIFKNVKPFIHNL